MKWIITLIFPFYLVGQDCDDYFDGYSKHPDLFYAKIVKMRNYLSNGSYDLWTQAYLMTYQHIPEFKTFLRKVIKDYPYTESPTFTEFLKQ